ncbi:MAG: SMP-30/gluconolactonase/LRE family protein [Ekhidna sp.]|nr:SMP-30/gluconolactonase/LRE family protein [Ekhidna sp.]
MKKLGRIFLIVILLLVAFVLYTLSSTGYFREITNTEQYKVIAEVPLFGAEDFTISYEDAFMIISSDDRGAKYHERKREGGLYLLPLDSPSFELIELESPIPMLPHGISLLKLDSTKYQLLVVSHYESHTIKKFELYGDSLVHIETFQDDAIVSPNDVVALDESCFYFTNDHGYTSKVGLLAENYLGLAVSDVTFYDGQNYVRVASGIAYANGINISKDQSQLLVASPRSFSLRFYNIEKDGTLIFDRSLDVGSGIDNIELDQKGNLWMGSHPSLLAFTAYSGGKKEFAPSEVIVVENGNKVSSVYENDGSFIAGSSVAAPYKDLIFIGTVMDDRMVVLKKK